jgi:hypothetical protein
MSYFLLLRVLNHFMFNSKHVCPKSKSLLNFVSIITSHLLRFCWSKCTSLDLHSQMLLNIVITQFLCSEFPEGANPLNSSYLETVL